MPDRPQQPFLTRLGSNLSKPLKKGVSAVKFWSALQSNQLSLPEQHRASVEMAQKKQKTSTSEKWITDYERAAAIEQPNTYTGGLNKKPEEEQTSLDVTGGETQAKNKNSADFQSEDQQNALDSEADTSDPASAVSPATSAPRNKRAPSPLERRRMLEQIKNKETEIADLEGKTGSTRRKEKIDKVIKEIIKMAALAETVIALIYYLIKILIIEAFAHKDGSQAKKLKQQITEKKDELTSLKRQARQMQITR